MYELFLQATLTPDIMHTLQPLFPNLVQLDLADCIIQPGSAENLAGCTKLQVLALTGRKVLPGAEEVRYA
jgi:hypothetical protein